jgi:hypothetical protein
VGGVNVAGSLGFALRDGTPPIEGGIGCRRGNQAVDVAMVKRFETNVLACQQKIFSCHGSQDDGSQYAASQYE